MPAKRTTRQQEFVDLEYQARRRQAFDLQIEDGQYLDRRPRELGINTMEAPDEVMERRRARHRKRVEMTAGGAAPRNALLENILVLGVLIASIYGMYRLCLYLLNQ